MRNKRFEQWFAKHIGEGAALVAQMYDGQTYRSWDYHVEIAWAAWCAAQGYEPDTKENDDAV